MSALDGVLADLVESDRECAYATVQRQPLEALIQEWADRGDQIALLCGLMARVEKELQNARAGSPPVRSQPERELLLRQLHLSLAEAAPLIAHHRHAVRLELAAQLKQTLRATVTEIRSRIDEVMLGGNRELAERLESERQTVQIVISAIDAMENRLFTRDLAAVSIRQNNNATPSA